MENKKKIVYFLGKPEFMNILGTEVALIERTEFTDVIVARNKDDSFETLDTVYIPMRDEDFVLERAGC
jgi:hypothetical protein